jgi:hypothetical protein
VGAGAGEWGSEREWERWGVGGWFRDWDWDWDWEWEREREWDWEWEREWRWGIRGRAEVGLRVLLGRVRGAGEQLLH